MVNNVTACDSTSSRALEKLRRDLGCLICDALDDPTTVEVMLNPDGSLWQERLSETSFQIGTLEWARGE